MTEFVSVSLSGRVAIVRLNRPERRNALSLAMVDDLVRFLSTAPGSEIGAVLLVGEGPVFCAGSDIKEISASGSAARVDHERRWPELARYAREYQRPIVAGIQGGAFGGGLFLGAFADVRLAASDALFAAPEVALGWFPPGGVEELIGLIGVGPARNMILTSTTRPATQLRAWGYVDEIVDARELEAASLEVARHLASLPLLAVADCRRYFGQRSGLDREAQERLQIELYATGVGSPFAEASLARLALGRPSSGT